MEVFVSDFCVYIHPEITINLISVHPTLTMFLLIKVDVARSTKTVYFWLLSMGFKANNLLR